MPRQAKRDRHPTIRKRYAKTGFKRPTGVILKQNNAPNAILSSVALPKDFHFSQKDLLPSLDQGQCGSCWAHSITEMLSNRVYIYSKGQIAVPLSRQQLIDCAVGSFASGCDGAVLHETCEYLTDNQVVIVPESAYPYTGTQSRCQNITNSDYGVKSVAVYNVCRAIDGIGSESHLSNIQNMKQHIYQHGPISIGLMIYKDFYDYDGVSIYEPSPSAEPIGGHAVLCIGWGVEPTSGQEYWVCRNSWGDQWPPHYVSYFGPDIFFIRAGINACKIEELSVVGCIPQIVGSIPQQLNNIVEANAEYTQSITDIQPDSVIAVIEQTSVKIPTKFIIVILAVIISLIAYKTLAKRK